ncbi:hypothetical protein CALCODRAFT_497072 [Calocera cornea HHB12733]|uniref:TFIIS N-terminal domain-containing protein n=1 Tax=Calocera cornea HHB12733 TaxID=1353952 RepID=A0A165FHA1_9BASI|nr:hypothetical protein CALCODRAFT_497072 [Calocera cornea HHB12733]
MAEPTKEQELLNDIFGSESELSDVEDEVAPEVRSRSPVAPPAASPSASPSRSASEERPGDEYRDEEAVRKLPKIQKKSRRAEGEGDGERKVKKRRRERRERSPHAREEGVDEPVPVELTAEEKRRRDLDQQLDAIIKPSKGMRRRRRKDDGDDTFADEEVVRVRDEMKIAALEDEEAIAQKKPALAKLRMLPEVMDVLRKQNLQTAILDNGMLDAVTRWLEPIKGDKSLPAMNIQNALFDVLKKMDIDTNTLRECDLGKVVLFYTKCPRVQEHIKRSADQLVDTWSRPIINRSANYRNLDIPLAPVDSAGSGQISLARILAEGKQSPDKASQRIRIPERQFGVYTVAPRSQVLPEGRAGEGDEARERRRREQERFKRLQRKLQLAKQQNARV